MPQVKHATAVQLTYERFCLLAHPLKQQGQNAPDPSPVIKGQAIGVWVWFAGIVSERLGFPARTPHRVVVSGGHPSPLDTGCHAPYDIGKLAMQRMITESRCELASSESPYLYYRPVGGTPSDNDGDDSG